MIRRCGLSEYIAIGEQVGSTSYLGVRKPNTGDMGQGILGGLVFCTRTSARRSRTLMQMHTPTRTPGVAEGGSGALLANEMEAFQQTAGLFLDLHAEVPGREDDEKQDGRRRITRA